MAGSISTCRKLSELRPTAARSRAAAPSSLAPLTRSASIFIRCQLRARNSAALLRWNSVSTLDACAAAFEAPAMWSAVRRTSRCRTTNCSTMTQRMTAPTSGATSVLMTIEALSKLRIDLFLLCLCRSKGHELLVLSRRVCAYRDKIPVDLLNEDGFWLDLLRLRGR